MPGENFYLYSIVEGRGEVKSLPKLLHNIWGETHLGLRTDEPPYFVPKDIFFNNENTRRLRALNWAKYCVKKTNKGGVLILMDADDACCKDFLQSEKMKAVLADIKQILGNIPCAVVLIERKYESWLAAGLGYDDGGAENHLKRHLGRAYRKTMDQVGLISGMDIEQTAKKNSSFCRFQKKILAWRDGEGKIT